MLGVFGMRVQVCQTLNGIHQAQLYDYIADMKNMNLRSITLACQETNDLQWGNRYADTGVYVYNTHIYAILYIYMQFRYSGETGFSKTSILYPWIG